MGETTEKITPPPLCDSAPLRAINLDSPTPLYPQIPAKRSLDK